MNDIPMKLVSCFRIGSLVFAATLLPQTFLAAEAPVLRTSVKPEGNSAVLSWSAKNATNVFIFGYDSVPHPVEGFLRTPGSYIILALGPGGATAQTSGAYVKELMANGSDGLTLHISADDVFRDADYFKFAAQRSFATAKPLLSLAEGAEAALSRRGYVCGRLPLPIAELGQLVFTLTYEPLPGLAQSAAQRRREGKVVRQAAFTVLVRNETNSPMPSLNLKVRPLVLINYPRDNNKWTNAVPDAALKEAEAIAREIEAFAKDK